MSGLTGRYRPQEALSAFDGHSRSGTWTLNVTDSGPEDVGTLNAWGLSPGARCDVFRLPTSVTNPASGIAEVSATLNGSHNSSGIPTDYLFEYGTTSAYGERTPVADGGSGDTATPVSATLSSLSPDTQYHFRLIALRDGVVFSRGGDQVFRTSAQAVAPSDTTPPSVTVKKAPKKKVVTKKAKVKVKVSFTSEPGAAFTCKLDKGKAKKCTSPFAVQASAKPGKGKKHTIRIVATDQAGNTSPPKAVTFTAVRKR